MILRVTTVHILICYKRDISSISRGKLAGEANTLIASAPPPSLMRRRLLQVIPLLGTRASAQLMYLKKNK